MLPPVMEHCRVTGSSSHYPTRDKERQRRVNPPCPSFTPNYNTLHLSAQHRIQNSSSRKRVSSALSRRPLSTSNKTIRRRRCKSAVSSMGTEGGESDDENKSVMTDLDMMSPEQELNENVYDEVDEIIMHATGKEHEDISQKTYRRACRALHITPATTVLKSLVAKDIILRNHVIGERGAKACAIALLDNGMVEQLDLEGNALGPNGTVYICDMLQENIFISDLNLAGNNLGTEGLIHIMGILRRSDTLKRVNLSANGFKEDDALHIADMLRDNVVLEELNLSYNEFRERGGMILGDALVDNTCLEVLDLSWNHLRLAGAVAVANGVQRNISIKKLNLGWNGFHLEGCRALALALEFNNTLEHLDLTCNRIDTTCLDHLIRGLRYNTSLKHLTLAKNPVSTEGATSILDFLIRTPDSCLEYISIAGQDVDRDFLKRLEDLRDVRDNSVVVVFGLTMKQDQIRQIQNQAVFLKEDPLMILMEYMRLRNLRPVDLFHCLDDDKSNSLSKEEFRRGLMKSGVPLTEKMLDRLIYKLDTNRNGEVEFTELIDGQKEHKRKVMKIIDNAIDQNIAFERTEIGRVSDKLRTIMKIKEHFWANKIKRMQYATNQSTTTSTMTTLQGITAGILEPFKVPRPPKTASTGTHTPAVEQGKSNSRYLEKKPGMTSNGRLLESRVSTLSVVKA